jgi:hypothetical protein
MAYEKEEIASLIEEDTQLPSTHRRGYPNRRNDVAEDADGMPTQVPTPETPDDRFN